MGRQRCVINAIIEQANPANMLARYEQIAKAGKQIVITDIPQEVLPLLVNLSLRVKNGQTRSVLFQQGVNFRSFIPIFPAMRKLVDGRSRDPGSPSRPSKSKKKASPSPAQPARHATERGLGDTCAFDPEIAADGPAAPLSR